MNKQWFVYQHSSSFIFEDENKKRQEKSNNENFLKNHSSSHFACGSHFSLAAVDGCSSQANESNRDVSIGVHIYAGSRLAIPCYNILTKVHTFPMPMNFFCLNDDAQRKPKKKKYWILLSRINGFCLFA